MTGSRSQCLATARKLIRTFASAPDARRRAQEIFHELARIDGLSPAERTQVSALGAWLEEKPSTGQLKSRCETVVAGFQ